MASATNIEWTDFNWNFLRGCSRVSEGCRNCYAEKIAGRFSGEGMPYHGLATQKSEARWTGDINFYEDILLQPLKWRKPRRVFVNSMSDLFHEGVADEWIENIITVMANCPQHTFQILTKRPERMREFLTKNERDYVLPNAWWGVSVEDQKTADERIPLLLQTPAAVRWISAEPLLSAVDLTRMGTDGEPFAGLNALTGELPGSHENPHIYDWMQRLDWVVTGGESGPQARPCDISWIRSIVDQCKAAGVPVFYKQGGASNKCPHSNKGGCFECFPDDLKIREFPNGTQ